MPNFNNCNIIFAIFLFRWKIMQFKILSDMTGYKPINFSLIQLNFSIFSIDKS